MPQSFLSPWHQLLSRVGLEGHDLGVRSSQLRKAGFGGAVQGCAVLSVQQYTHSPDGRIYTKALIVWLIKAGSILTRTEPRAQLKASFAPLPSPCALRNSCSGVAVMRKRQQNWGVVAEDHCSSNDVVTWGRQRRWLIGTCRGSGERVGLCLESCPGFMGWGVTLAQVGMQAGKQSILWHTLQRFTQWLGEVRHYKVYLLLTGAGIFSIDLWRGWLRFWMH